MTRHRGRPRRDEAALFVDWPKDRRPCGGDCQGTHDLILNRQVRASDRSTSRSPSVRDCQTVRVYNHYVRRFADLSARAVPASSISPSRDEPRVGFGVPADRREGCRAVARLAVVFAPMSEPVPACHPPRTLRNRSRFPDGRDRRQDGRQIDDGRRAFWSGGRSHKRSRVRLAAVGLAVLHVNPSAGAPVVQDLRPVIERGRLSGPSLSTIAEAVRRYSDPRTRSKSHLRTGRL